MTAQLSKGPPSPPEKGSKWRPKGGGNVFKVRWISSSGASVHIHDKNGPVLRMRVTTLRRDYEEVK